MKPLSGDIQANSNNRYLLFQDFLAAQFLRIGFVFLLHFESLHKRFLRISKLLTQSVISYIGIECQILK